MAQNPLIAAVRKIALFEGLPPLQITEIARRADRIVYKPGATIVRANQPLDAAIIIIAGTAQRISGPGLAGSPQELGEGTLLSEMAMLIETEPGSTIIAKTEVRALRLPREEMHRLMAQDQGLADHFIAKSVGRLRAIAEEMRQVESGLAQHGEPPAFAAKAPPPVLPNGTPDNAASPTRH